jgi:hypothetical protein
VRSVALVLLALVSTDALAQGCALTPGRTGNFQTLSNAAGVVAFSSGLAVNADGAPNAYHRVLGPTTRDPGLLHICNGVAVLERAADGRMVDRYSDFSVPGTSARCKPTCSRRRNAASPRATAASARASSVSSRRRGRAGRRRTSAACRRSRPTRMARRRRSS